MKNSKDNMDQVWAHLDSIEQSDLYDLIIRLLDIYSSEVNCNPPSPKWYISTIKSMLDK